jgi:hypothetical protein
LQVAGWIILIALPSWNRSDLFLTGVVVTLLLLMLTQDFAFDDWKKFGTIDGIQGMFESKTVVVAGWVHYLAFDLMTGIFIRKNAGLHGVNYWLTLPCLILTFMWGPAGLLLYFIIRWFVTRHYFATNYE